MGGHPGPYTLIFLCFQIQVLELPHFVGEYQSELPPPNPRCLRPVLDILAGKIGQKLLVLGILNFNNLVAGHRNQIPESESLVLLLRKVVAEHGRIEPQLNLVFTPFGQK